MMKCMCVCLSRFCLFSDDDDDDNEGMANTNLD